MYWGINAGHYYASNGDASHLLISFCYHIIHYSITPLQCCLQSKHGNAKYSNMTQKLYDAQQKYMFGESLNMFLVEMSGEMSVEML